MMMARHPESEDVMSWIDGELAADRAEQIRAHVSGCADCQSIAQELGSVKGQLMTWQVEPAPATLRPTKAQRGSVVGATRPSWRWRLPRWSYVLAASAAVVAIVVLLPMSGRRSAVMPATVDESRADKTEAMSAQGRATRAFGHGQQGGAGGRGNA